MSTRTWDAVPGDTPVLFSRYCIGHRVTSVGPACGSRTETRLTTATAMRGRRYLPCPDPKCWGGGRPW